MFTSYQIARPKQGIGHRMCTYESKVSSTILLSQEKHLLHVKQSMAEKRRKIALSFLTNFAQSLRPHNQHFSAQFALLTTLITNCLITTVIWVILGKKSHFSPGYPLSAPPGGKGSRPRALLPYYLQNFAFFSNFAFFDVKQQREEEEQW